MSALAKAHRALAFAVLVAVPIQFFLAGLGAFGAADWGLHAIFGLVMILLGLVVLILGAISRRMLGPSAILFGLLILQFVLAGVSRAGVPEIAALHPVNALLILGAAHWVATGQRAPGRAPAAVGAGEGAGRNGGSLGREREGAARVR